MQTWPNEHDETDIGDTEPTPLQAGHYGQAWGALQIVAALLIAGAVGIFLVAVLFSAMGTHCPVAYLVGVCLCGLASVLGFLGHLLAQDP